MIRLKHLNVCYEKKMKEIEDWVKEDVDLEVDLDEVTRDHDLVL